MIDIDQGLDPFQTPVLQSLCACIGLGLTVCNLQMTTGPGASGVFSGQVVELWQALGTSTPVGIGATFDSGQNNFTPTILLVNGDKCTLKGAK